MMRFDAVKRIRKLADYKRTTSGLVADYKRKTNGLPPENNVLTGAKLTLHLLCEGQPSHSKLKYIFSKFVRGLKNLT